MGCSHVGQGSLEYDLSESVHVVQEEETRQFLFANRTQVTQKFTFRQYDGSIVVCRVAPGFGDEKGNLAVEVLNKGGRMRTRSAVLLRKEVEQLVLQDVQHAARVVMLQRMFAVSGLPTDLTRLIVLYV